LQAGCENNSVKALTVIAETKKKSQLFGRFCHSLQKVAAIKILSDIKSGLNVSWIADIHN